MWSLFSGILSLGWVLLLLEGIKKRSLSLRDKFINLLQCIVNLTFWIKLNVSGFRQNLVMWLQQLPNQRDLKKSEKWVLDFNQFAHIVIIK